MEKRYNNDLVGREEHRFRTEDERRIEGNDAGCSHTEEMAEEVSCWADFVITGTLISSVSLTIYRPDFSFEDGTECQVASQGRTCLHYQQTEIKGRVGVGIK